MLDYPSGSSTSICASPDGALPEPTMPHARRGTARHALRLDASSIRYGSIAGVIALLVSWVVQKI